MGKIRVGLVGIGNCASAIVQAVYMAKKNPSEQAINNALGGYRVSDVEFTAAFDVDVRKIGKDLAEAIFAGHNMVPRLVELEETGVIVRPGPVLDGVAPHMVEYFRPHDSTVTLRDVIEHLESTETEIVVNMLPVGSEEATRFYAEASLLGGAAFVNGIPVFIASDPTGYWPRRYREAGLPLLGDDIKGQFGATILHSALTALMRERGLEIESTYQLNIGGNTDFLNLMMEERLASKRKSKTKAVKDTIEVGPRRISDENIRIGPSDYVPFLGNTKVAYIYIRARSYLGFPVELDVKLKVDDKSMFAAAMLDAIRLAKIALDRGLAGAIHEASAYYFKHPPRPVRSPHEAKELLEKFLAGEVAEAREA
ncbi:MAG: inositol-3-phosphate synthase [Fervidicoccaceae archaeon]